MENMEGRLLKKIKFSAILFLLIFLSQTFFAQSTADKIRIPLWAQLDAYPGTEGAVITQDELFEYPISRLKEVAPFFVEGMVCGWTFSYTPSDKLRNVDEYFEFTPLYDFSAIKKNITYKDPWLKDNRLYCWVEFEYTPQIASWVSTWQKSNFRRISGAGEGPISEGFDGIKIGAQNALKSAVREYARSIKKNKPKEIIGEVLITNNPSVYIRSGRYLIEIDFLLNINKIIEYNIY